MLSSGRAISFRRTWVCSSCRCRSTVSDSRSKLPSKPARTRFAPSPTGYLHLGSLRTALFNYLVARATGGKFILRVEDTDKKRTVPDAERRLYQDLKWAGLDWDEGPDIGGLFGPYKQSERTTIYQKHAEDLLKSGHAYRCFCSAERLNALATQRKQLGLSGEYDRACLHSESSMTEKWLSVGEPHVIRLKVPDETPTFNDIVYGTVGQSNEKRLQRPDDNAFEDPILIKSDGQPTYHLANVVDDHYMEISHVIRATEWMSSTPKHLTMYRALGWAPPEYAHVGLLQNNKREKFSKRNDDVDLQSFKKEGIFPEALINFVALFGWSHKFDSDFLRMQDLINSFSFKFTKGNTIAAPAKLFYLQKKYAVKYVEENGQDFDFMVERVSAIAEENLKSQPGGFEFKGSELKHRVNILLSEDAAKYTTPQDFFDGHVHFFRSVSRPPLDLKADHQVLGLISDHLHTVYIHISQVSTEKWTRDVIRSVIEKLSSVILNAQLPGNSLAGLKEVRVAVNLYLRWATTGGRPGLGIPLTMEILGQKFTIQRLEEATVEYNTLKGQEKVLGEGAQASNDQANG